ncbi:phage tail length tape measure family protein [Azospirillum argentinense]|uniref:Bacteriophage tail tape measure N-terminal domain-containing protein n=1 Tax=Azospirillum argentinense TaxID=2970906 RepID=A0A5B0KM73_9PROT|nr:phage tail length tape measure family protein [Azospirillum argentinense]KAA1052956.1 Phage tail tape measure protein [Azospirillum argentinense]
MTEGNGSFVSEEQVLSLTIEAKQAVAALAEMDRSLESTARAADRTAESSGKLDKAADATSRVVETATRRLREADREFQALERRIPGSAAAMDRYNRLVEQANRAHAAGRFTADQHSKALEELRRKYLDAGTAATQAAGRIASASDTAAQSANRLRGALGQVGFQVQDVAVQLAGGQSPFLVLAQRGSQVAGAFGPAGAAIGAVIAVAGAAAMALGSLGGEEKRAKELADAHTKTRDALNNVLGQSAQSVDELAARYRTLNAEMRKVEEAALLQTARKAAEEMDKLRTTVPDKLDELRDTSPFRAGEYEKRLSELGAPTGEAAKRLAEFNAATGEIEKFQKGGTIPALVSGLLNIADAGGPMADELRKAAGELADSALKANELDANGKRVAAMLALLKGEATDADKAIINLGVSTDSTGEKAQTLADVLATVNAMAAEAERNRLGKAYELLNSTLEDARTPAEKYRETVSEMSEALALLRQHSEESGDLFPFSEEDLARINEHVQQLDPALKEMAETAKRVAEDVCGYPNDYTPTADDTALFMEALS